MLFLLTMEVLGALIRKSDGWSLLQSFTARLSHRTSFYADDLMLFIAPSAVDIRTMRYILMVFEEASRLGCNLAKCQMMPIRCTDDQVDLATGVPCQVVNFLVTYLGIPLAVTKLPKSALQPLLDRVADNLPI
jgi:hypothetical protein